MSMKKKWVVELFSTLAFLWCIWSFGSMAQAAPQAVLPENKYEFSPVVEGATVAHGFTIKNVGDEPLRILKIDSG